jgi:hypothetical protein
MHNILSVIRILLVLNATLVLLLLLPTGSALANDTYCDPKLGRNYDEQTVEVKMSRMNFYLDCRQSRDLRFLKTLRNDIVIGTQKWENRATHVIHSSLITKKNMTEAEFRTAHGMERGELDADYRNQIAAIDAARAADNTAEIAQKWRATTVAYRGDRKEMMSRHNQETRSMRTSFTQCSLLSNNQIKQMLGADTQSIGQQFLDKIARLKGEYRNLTETPMTMSPNDYAAMRENVVNSMQDTNTAYPVGTIVDVDGSGGTVTSPSGETVPVVPGTTVSPGDVVTMEDGSTCNIVFADGTSLEMREGSRLEIDEYVYDPTGGDDRHDFSILRGIFVFTSGLIGHREVQDVDISVNGFGSGIRG